MSHNGFAILVQYAFVECSTGVVLVGSSFITHLSSYLEQRELSLQVPLPVRMIGESGLHLNAIRRLVDREVGPRQPAIIVLHVGANVIGLPNEFEWIRERDRVVSYLRVRFPRANLGWSDMLPRLYWRHCFSSLGAENARRRNQRRARGIVRQAGGSVIPHLRILPSSNHLSDGVHLSESAMK